jgi:hypothetical protein
MSLALGKVQPALDATLAERATQEVSRDKQYGKDIMRR